MEPLYPLQHDPPILHPPQVTSWGIALRTNACKLWPNHEEKFITISGQDHRFLWALRITVAWRGNFEDLPSVLLLVQSRPARYSYRLERVIDRMCSTETVRCKAMD